MSKLNPDEWSRFWEESTITTFGPLFKNNYDGEILEFWLQQLEGDYRHVVDLACGNGALAWIANEALNKNGAVARITGVDIADIKPFKKLKLKKEKYPNVSFIGRTSIEKLPFENHSIDLVISQYGIEYSDLEKSIPELSRVLSENGKMSFIMHDKESVLIKAEAEITQACRSVLNDEALHDKYLSLDSLYRSSTNNSQEIQNLKAEIMHQIYRIQNKMRSFRLTIEIDKYLDTMSKAFAPNIPRKSKKRELVILNARDQLSTYVSRLEDLQAAALSAKDLDRMVALIESENFSITEQKKLKYRGEQICGSILVAERGR